MNHTPNYALNQWEASDQLRRVDVNADNAKIDAALKTQADALSAAVAAIPKLAAGSYTGDGAATRFISTGFTPKAVFVSTVDGYTYSFSNGYGPSQAYGGLAVTDSPGGYGAVTIVSGGFQVAYQKENSSVCSNYKDRKFNYIALA